MPFKEVDINDEIQKRLDADPEFKEAWESSRMEYRLLGEFTRLRKEKGLSQTDLAEQTGNTQQVISRIEQHEQSPTLKTLCNMANALGVDIQIVRR